MHSDIWAQISYEGIVYYYFLVFYIGFCKDVINDYQSDGPQQENQEEINLQLWTLNLEAGLVKREVVQSKTAQTLLKVWSCSLNYMISHLIIKKIFFTSL